MGMASEKYKLGKNYTESELASLMYPWAIHTEDEEHSSQENNTADDRRCSIHAHPLEQLYREKWECGAYVKRTIISAANADAEYVKYVSTGYLCSPGTH